MCVTFAFDDAFTLDEKCATKDSETGETHYVPSDMTYTEWYNKYVASKPAKARAYKKNRNASKDKGQYKRYKKVLGKDLGVRSLSDFQYIKYSDGTKWAETKSNYRKVSAYNRIASSEPAITSDLKDIAKETGTKLVGLEYELKTKDSYLRKIDAKSKGSLDITEINKAVEGTGDVIRYTYETNPLSLVDKYDEISDFLIAKGYSKVQVKNYWLNKRNPYNGVNTNYKTSEGQKFEIQFHTPESLEIKEKIHKLYEKQRVLPEKNEEWKALKHEMQEITKDMTVPQGIEGIN